MSESAAAPPPLIDGHLDLADNVLRKGRDLTLELDELRRREGRTSEEIMVTLPELRRAGIAIVLATIFVMPRFAASDPRGTYETPAEARALAIAQLELYQRWEEAGLIRILRTRDDLEAHLAAGEPAEARVSGVDDLPASTPKERPTGLILLMEGAEPLRDPNDLSWWWEQGLRIIGPAWKATRYAGGTGMPGPLSELGRELILATNDLGLALDVSHLAEESFWDAVELSPKHVLASHSNSRSFVDSERHLTDEMATEIGKRDGVVSLVLANPFLKAGVTKQHPKEAVTLDDVRAQAEHLARLVGWHRLGFGSDFDGGFGLQETPLGLTRATDFRELGRVAPAAHRAGVLGGNLLEFLRRSLPA